MKACKTLHGKVFVDGSLIRNNARACLQGNTRARDYAAKGEVDIFIVLQTKDFAHFLLKVGTPLLSLAHCKITGMWDTLYERTLPSISERIIQGALGCLALQEAVSMQLARPISAICDSLPKIVCTMPLYIMFIVGSAFGKEE